MDLFSMPKEQLLSRTDELAADERRVTTEMLRHLLAIERRRVFADIGFSSLFDYCIKRLRYSESAACRRIYAMRLLRDLPEVEQKIETGSLTLSTASQLHSFCRKVKKGKEEKRELVAALEGKSKRQCDKVLASIAPQMALPESVRVIDEKNTEIRFVADEDLMAMLKRFQELKGHSDYLTLFKRMAKLALEKAEPKAPTKPESECTADGGGEMSKAETIRHVWKRDESQCTHIDKQTGHRCTSRYRLEVDHVQPTALGGKTELSNLRLVCRAHNQLYAIQQFGQQKMDPFLRGA